LSQQGKIPKEKIVSIKEKKNKIKLTFAALSPRTNK